jgi:hypothetical protein
LFKLVGLIDIIYFAFNRSRFRRNANWCSLQLRTCKTGSWCEKWRQRNNEQNC